MKPELIRDRMATSDRIITTPSLSVMPEQAAPHGRLFQVLGRRANGSRILREIECNTVVVGGAITALENLMGVAANWKPSTLNTIHDVSATAATGAKPTLCLFGIGYGGANLSFGSVVDPDIKQRDVLNPIPMRYTTAATPSGSDANKYFMKVTGQDYNSWFLKQFTTTPVIKTLWKNGASEDEDGTEITSDIYNSQSTDGIETFTEIQINLNTLDGREYYVATEALSTARYNTIGFYTGTPNSDGTEYADVRLYSVITFNNRDLSLKSSSEFLYRVYSLI